MAVAVIDARRYGKQKRYYILKSGVSDNNLLPVGMVYNKEEGGITGDPSPEYYREVKREDFP